MALTSYQSASPTITATEYSLAAATTSGVPTAQTDDGVYSLSLAMSSFSPGDQFLVQLYEKAVSGGTQRLVETWTITASGEERGLFLVLPGILGHGWDLTIKKIAGTDRTTPFTLWRSS